MIVNPNGTTNHLIDDIIDGDQDDHHVAIQDGVETYELAELMEEIIKADELTCKHVINRNIPCRIEWTDADEDMLKLELVCKKCGKRAVTFVETIKFTWLD